MYVLSEYLFLRVYQFVQYEYYFSETVPLCEYFRRFDESQFIFGIKNFASNTF